MIFWKLFDFKNVCLSKKNKNKKENFFVINVYVILAKTVAFRKSVWLLNQKSRGHQSEYNIAP